MLNQAETASCWQPSAVWLAPIQLVVVNVSDTGHPLTLSQRCPAKRHQKGLPATLAGQAVLAGSV